MNKHSSAFRAIPSVLSVPEKVSAFAEKLFRLRLPVERHFSGRDFILMLVSALLVGLSCLVKPLAGIRTVIQLLALAVAAVPLCLQAYSVIVTRKLPPLEEEVWLIAAILAALIGEITAAPMILIFADLLCLTEGYCLLHRDAADEFLADADLKLRHGVETADSEKSPERRKLAFAALAFLALFLFVALVFAVCALFHRDNALVWLHRTLAMLVLAGPSAFLFSAMLTHFGAIYSAAKADIRYADDEIPEFFARCRLFAFSKTGTVTDGKYRISEIIPAGVTEEELLRIAAIAECKSLHPIAMAVKAAAGLQEGAVPEEALETSEIPGKGVSTFFSGHQIYVGNAGLLEEHGIWCPVPEKSGSAIHIALDGSYRGYIMIADAIRENAFEALEELRADGATTLFMLTGDVRSTARTLASSLNFDMVKPELSPKDKASAIRYLRSSHGDKARIACIGDGLHDREMFEESDISICMGAEREDCDADVVISSDQILSVPLAYRICRTTERVFLLDTAVLLLMKLLLAVLACSTTLGIITVSALDCLLGVAAVLHGLTCLTLEKRGGGRE